MMYTRQKQVRPTTTMRRRLAATAAALAAVSVAGLMTAAPASAAVKQTCGAHICVATAYQGTHYVQDITVWTKDGLPGKLRGFAGNWSSHKLNDDRNTFPVNRELSSGSGRLKVCGGLDRSNRVIENHCVLIP